jgi:hypothetical protein
MKIIKLVVGRGSSTEIKYGKAWVKRYFSIEAELSETDQLDQVKQQLETQLEEWLK